MYGRKQTRNTEVGRLHEYRKIYTPGCKSTYHLISSTKLRLAGSVGRVQVLRNCWWYSSFTRTRITGPGTVLLMVAAGVHCAAQQQTEGPRQGSAPAATPSSSAAKFEQGDVVLSEDPVFWASFVLQGVL